MKNTRPPLVTPIASVPPQPAPPTYEQRQHSVPWNLVQQSNNDEQPLHKHTHTHTHTQVSMHTAIRSWSHYDQTKQRHEYCGHGCKSKYITPWTLHNHAWTHTHTQKHNQPASTSGYDAICGGVLYTTQLIPTTTAILTSYEVYHTQSTLLYRPVHLCNGDSTNNNSTNNKGNVCKYFTQTWSQLGVLLYVLREE